MKWYTLDNGRLCLGTNQLQYANFHTATEVQLDQNISLPLLPEHIELIGSFPEYWYADELIDDKINNTARHFFGLNTSKIGTIPA